MPRFEQRYMLIPQETFIIGIYFSIQVRGSFHPTHNPRDRDFLNRIAWAE